MKVGVTTTLPPGQVPVRRHIWKPKRSADMLTPPPQLSPADVPTPPAGTPAPRLLSADVTPPPRMKSQADLTPPPRRPTPRPMLPLASRLPTLPPLAETMVQGIHVAKGTLAGLCLLMFSFGVITTVLVDRYWPTRKAEWATAPGQIQAPAAQPAAPAPAAAAESTKTDPPSPPPSPSVEPVAVDVPRPLEAKAASTAATAPAARLEPDHAPVTKAVPPPAQGRGPANKRPGTGRPVGSPAHGSDRTMAPTGTWVDPFE